MWPQQDGSPQILPWQTFDAFLFSKKLKNIIFFRQDKNTEKLTLVHTYHVFRHKTNEKKKILLDKKSIRCACLGTALKLPMTEATFIENAIMIVMAVIMLTNLL